MGLFGKKKQWDMARSDANKARLRELFNGVVEDSESYQVLYGYGLNIKNSDYIIARKTTYTYTSLIIGYRQSDMSIMLLQTTPELEGCSEPEIFKKDAIKKSKISTGMYTIYHQGGLFAGYTQFAALAENDENFLAYIYQPEEFAQFEAFFKQFSGKQSMTEWIEYLLLLVVICVIYFVATGVWVGLIDLIVSGFKKLFRLGNNKPEKWHSLEDIRKNDRQQERAKTLKNK